MSDRLKARNRLRRIVSCPHDWDWPDEREKHHGKMKYRRTCLNGCGAVSWTEREPPERREYDPSDDPEAAERQARREARERHEASEPWKCPSYWEGRDDGDR